MPLNDYEDSFLDIKNLTLEYEANKKIITPVRNISFQAKQYERLVLLGPSGCGKSTILKAVGGFLKLLILILVIHLTHKILNII